MRLALLLLPLALGAAEIQRVDPGGVKPIGPYSPGLFAGDYLYVSGQGARDAQNRIAPTIEEQTRQTLRNVKAIVEAAGLTMDHVAYTHLYLADIKNYEAVNKVWSEFFPNRKPARATIAVTRMPGDTPVEINAIAVRDAAKLKVIELPGEKSPVPISPAIETGNRLYVAGILGRLPQTGEVGKDEIGQSRMAYVRLLGVLKAAGYRAEDLASLTCYATTPKAESECALFGGRALDGVARSIVRVPALPFGVTFSVTAVAGRNLARHGNCTRQNDTTWCGLVAGKAGGADMQANDVITRMDAALKVAGASVDHVVASNVYLDSIDEFTLMNGAYGKRFTKLLPTRTTVQPAPTGASPRFRLHVVAVQ
jgi:2-iminobutanoate/2-iminopropanoate deaminase